MAINQSDIDNAESDSINDTEPTVTQKELNRVQEIFLMGQERLSYFNKIRSARSLTNQETFEDERYRNILYKQIERFATQLMNNYTKGYIIDSDEREEIMGDIADKFFEKLPCYDPRQNTPTTFFKPFILEAIRSFINNRSQHLSPNDAGNLKKINKASKECEAAGIEPTEEILHNKTKLSSKVIRNTLKKSENTIYCDISEVKETSTSMDPALIYESEDTLNKLHSIINESLSSDDIDMLMTYANFGSEDTLTYKEMAAIYNLPEHTIKSRMSKIFANLQTNSNTKKLGFTNSEFNSNLSFIDSSSNEIEDDIIRTLTI